MGASGYKVGQVIELNDGRKGRIRYVGNFHLKAGEWIGVELDDASGKNDGEVQGKRYFDCESNHGMFVQPPAVSNVLQDAPAPAPAASAPPPKTSAAKRTSMVGNGVTAKTAARTSTTGRPSSLTGQPGATASSTTTAKRQSLLDGARARQSINSASPTPATRQPAARTIASPTKATTRAPISGSTRTAAASNGTSTTSLAAKRASLTGRPSATGTAPAAARPARTATVGSSAGTTRQPPTSATTRRPAARLASSTSSKPSPVSVASRRASIDTERASGDTQDGANRPVKDEDEVEEAANGAASVRAGQPSDNLKEPPSAGLSRPTTQQLSAQNRKIEDLETKLRIMEKQQLDSRDRLKEMEKTQSERDRFEGIIQKLQAKIQPQVEEISSLRKELKASNSRLDIAEQQQMDVDEAVELATLDREMAEELAEGYKAELDALRTKHEELVLETDILRAENEDLGREMSPEERNSMGFAQMEKSNERLREALIRLRDMAQDTEADYKAKIKELEDDLEDFSNVKEKYEEGQDNLSQAETLVEELRQQLETAQGSEDMLEELTDKNMSLTEQIEELRAAVQDLEDLREVSDELELNHVEHEKMMQDDIDYRETLLLEQARKATEQDETIEELEYTVGRFRELVTNLNSDLEEMKASQQITEAEANELSSRSKAMMDLNMRLQQSASKTQIKIIDTELKRLELQEATDQIAIVTKFLPDSYVQHRESTATFIRFKRVSFKASLLHGFLKERVAEAVSAGHEEEVFAACELLENLVWVVTMCDRFIRYIVSCPLDVWTAMGSTAYDLEPVERAFNGWIESLKRDDLKEAQCAAELQRTMSVLEHLSERYFSEGGLTDYAEQTRMNTVMMQSSLDSATAALSQIKSIAQARVVLPTDADEDDEHVVEAFNSRAESLIAQVRSIRVVTNKSLQQLDELTARSLTLEPSTQGTIETTRNLVEGFAKACREAGAKVAAVVNEDARTESLTHEHIATALSPEDASPFSSLASQANSVNNAIQSFSNLTTTLGSTVEFTVPPSGDDLGAQSTPWAQLAAQLHAQTSASADLDAEISRLNDTLTERSTALAMKDKSISELGVTIEVLQKRADDGSKATLRARELEVELETAARKLDNIEQEVSSKETEIRQLKTERETWAAAGAAAGVADDGNLVFDQDRMARAMEDMAEGGYMPPKAAKELDFLKAELEATRSVVAQLRQAATDASFLSAQSDGILEPLRTEALTDARKDRVLAGEKEAMDAMKALRQIVNREEVGIVQWKKTERGERLKWRPANERLTWQVGLKREEWQDWRDWVRDAAKQDERDAERREKIVEKTESAEGASGRQILAKLQLKSSKFGEKSPAQEIRIVDPSEWDGLSTRLGLSY